MNNAPVKVKVLGFQLSDNRVGYMAGYQDGRTVFTFSHEFINMDNQLRPTLSLKYYNKTENIYADRLASRRKLPPVFSNLLPEGELREFVIRNLKIHNDDEFKMISALGKDLPGALIATLLDAKDVPPYALEGRWKIEGMHASESNNDFGKFSLSGVQMKFSMAEKGGEFLISRGNHIGKWIVKIPSSRFSDVPVNEYSSMKLAEAAGIQIPEIRLIRLGNIQGFPQIKMPDEEYAYAVKRFDRDETDRIHSEDFAQVFELYPHEKYGATNYDTIARTIYNVFPDAVKDVREFIARLVVNIMIGNGDAHLKNFSIIYPDRKNPTLSPAYDILFTRVYTENDDSIALNLGREKRISYLSLDHFKYLAKKSDLDWRMINNRILETIALAREKWPILLKELPMADSHKEDLKTYWRSLSADFRIDDD